jgi:hypothetical protein
MLIENNFSSNFHIHVFVRYYHNKSAYSAKGKYVDRSWKHINLSRTHECGNWDGGHAILFLEIHKLDFRCSVAKIG